MTASFFVRITGKDAQNKQAKISIYIHCAIKNMMIYYRKPKSIKWFPKRERTNRIYKKIIAYGGEILELKERIIMAAIDAFNEKGLKFTMSDIASRLAISKKTIYTVFETKDEMFLEMVDYLFDRIKESEQAIVEDDSLTLSSKISRILGVIPESYKSIDLRQLYQLKDKYPEIYARVEERLENGWETTLELMNQGIEENIIRPVNLSIFKMMMEASLEQFFQRDILVRNNMTYAQGLEEVVGILLSGIMEV